MLRCLLPLKRFQMCSNVIIRASVSVTPSNLKIFKGRSQFHTPPRTEWRSSVSPRLSSPRSYRTLLFALLAGRVRSRDGSQGSQMAIEEEPRSENHAKRRCHGADDATARRRGHAAWLRPAAHRRGCQPSVWSAAPRRCSSRSRLHRRADTRSEAGNLARIRKDLQEKGVYCTVCTVQ